MAAPTSPASAPRRSATATGDEYVVNGAKTFITSGVRADFVTTAVRTGGPGHAGVSLIVVEAGTPGFTVDRSLRKMGWHCSDTAELSYVDVRVPAANLVGAENTGFYQIAEQFVVERIGLAVHAYGIAARSLELTAAYCRDRETFGKPLVANQVVRHKLVEMRRQVEVARTYTREVARRHVAGETRDRRGLPGEADRLRRRDVRLRPGGAAARRHRLHARDRGGAALPRRPDPADRRRSDRGADRSRRTTAGVHRMSIIRPLYGEVSVHMAAPPEKVWALVSDVTRIGEFSPETFEARWTRGSTGPEVGASFKGHVKRNGVGPTYWSPCQVTKCVPNEVFEFAVGTDDVTRQQLGLPAAGRERRHPGHGVLPARARAAAADLLAAARPPARAHQRARHAHHARADEGGGGAETTHDETLTNREAMLEKLADLDAEHAKAVAGGGEKYVARHHERGKLMPRERIELLIDEGSAFLELSPLAGWGSDFAVGASVVTGIGVVEGVECMITANDPSVKGGASNPWTVKKIFRASQIAEENGLPTVALVESGGADLPTQKEIFIPGGKLFRDITRSSAAKQPTIALVFGNSTAGGAYVPGMSDYTVMVKERAKVFLGGPPLVKMATGEESDDESLGGAEMHARTSGLADYLAEDEHDAIRIGRRIVARLNWRKAGRRPPAPFAEPDADPDELLDLIPTDLKEPFDPREVISRICDGVSATNGQVFDEFKPLYGPSLVTGWARLHGRQIGILANAQGVLFSEEAQKATQFIQLANQIDVPLLFLHNTTGYMVGKEYEQGGIIKHGAMMINAVSNSTVPHLSVIMGASYGAGNYGMNGRAYDPRFLFTWPSAKSAVMGPAQLAGVLEIVARAVGRGQGRDVRRRGLRRRSRRSSRGRSRSSRCRSSSPGCSTTTA